MKRLRFKKIMSLVLIFCIILCEINATTVYADIKITYSGTIGPGGYKYATKDTKLPDGIDFKNKFNLQLNLSILEDKNLIVYGYYGDISNNDFKSATNTTGANDHSGDVQNQGYYIYTGNNSKYIGKKGEYRYHGFTKYGEKFSNANFPVDASMNKAADKYRYIYRRWEKTNKYFDGTKASGFNDIATNDLEDENISRKTYAQETIKSVLINSNFNINGEVPNHIGGNSSNAWDYANLLSVPTHFSAGEVEMQHLANNNTRWYVDYISPPVLPDKKVPDATATLTNDFSIDFSKIDKNSDYPVKLKLNANIEDDDYFTDQIDKHIYYTRTDIEYWKLIFTNKITGEDKEIKVYKYKQNHPNNIKVSSNYIECSHDFTIPNDWLKQKSKQLKEYIKKYKGLCFYVWINKKI